MYNVEHEKRTNRKLFVVILILISLYFVYKIYTGVKAHHVHKNEIVNNFFTFFLHCEKIYLLLRTF